MPTRPDSDQMIVLPPYDVSALEWQTVRLLSVSYQVG